MTTPAETKRIVCLANSRKLSGRCVAGKEILPDGQFGGWIRPVSARDTEEVSECERRYADGGDPRLLDVIDVPVLGARPTKHQRENWLLDSKRSWKFVRRVHPNELAGLMDMSAPLWVDGYSSSEGRNDRVPEYVASGRQFSFRLGGRRVPERAASSLSDSLRLIWTDNLELTVTAPGQSRGDFRRFVRGRFEYCGTDYLIRVTDPVIEGRYIEMPVGEYPIGGRFVTVSLAETAFYRYYYKLIAAIMDPREGAAP